METDKLLSVEEGNKIIAEFMGKVTTDSKEWLTSHKRLVGVYEYHTSWDWLMPVVEKIEDLGYSFYIIGVGDKGVGSFTHTLIDNGDISPTVIHDGYYEKSKIKSVWDAVIEFIQWYNKQLKQ